MPIRKGDGTGVEPKGISEVRKGDGTVLYSASPDIPDSVVDNFEPVDGDPAGPYESGDDITTFYGGDVGDVSRISSQTQSGSFAAEMTGSSSRMVISSISGLPRYPQQGETFQAYIRFDSAGGGDRHIRWATQDETNTPGGYAAGPSPFDNTLELSKFDGSGSENRLNSASQSWNTNTWYRIEVDWGSDGSITVTAYDGGTELQQVSITDNTYSSGGVGLGSNTPNSGDVIWYDSFEVV